MDSPEVNTEMEFRSQMSVKGRGIKQVWREGTAIQDRVIANISGKSKFCLYIFGGKLIN